MRDRLVLIIILILIALPGFSMQVKPEGSFHDDSIRIGEEILYSLMVTYPIDQDVVFPDSLYDFSPFELNRKDYFFTRSDGTTSFDSAVYNLSTFEIDSVQFLSLPIWVITNGDSIPYLTIADTVILNHVVTEIPDSINLIDNTIYKEVNYAWNYPYFIIGVLITTLVIFFVSYFYGGDIMKRYKLYKLKKMHKRFLSNYNQLIHSQKHDWEKSLLEWKVYMEKLDDKPYTKLTTKEIARKTRDNHLLKALKAIDRSIYGSAGSEGGNKYFEALVSFTRNAYANKVKKIKYGTER